MRNLRLQLLMSHLVLILLMVIVIIGGVVSVFHLGRSIDRILADNIKSVIAAQNMKEALERIDSSATFVLAGRVEKAQKQFTEYEPKFEEAFNVEDHNITERGERKIADDIRSMFAQYRPAVQRLLYASPPMPAAEASHYYFNDLEPLFVRLKSRAQDVLDINQAAIKRADSRARAEADRAASTGIAAAISAFVLALVLAVRMIGTALRPLLSLARQAEEVGAGHLNQRIELHRNDEIGTLAGAFNRMAANLQEARRIEEERLHRAERMSDAAIDSLYDPVVVTDSTGRVVHLNRAAEGIFGPAGNATGQGVGDVTSDSRIAEAVDRAIRHERISASEDAAGFIPLAVGKAQRTYRLRATPMHDDEGVLLGAVAVLEDVTHLHELDRLKTEFIGVASHELRTPVTSLLLSVQLLQEGAAGELTPEQMEIVSAQREDLERLERMMRDLLELTQLEAGVKPPRFEIVRPAEMVVAAMQSVSAAAETKGVSLGIDMPSDLPAVRADREQIQRVLVNLLTNAVRHTNGGGGVRVGVLRKIGRLAFEVRDTGAGIPRGYLPRIFERFVQVPGATRGGAGLGLSISQAIVQAHGGTIGAESEEGKGSVFTFSLPLPGERKERPNGASPADR